MSAFLNLRRSCLCGLVGLFLGELPAAQGWQVETSQREPTDVTLAEQVAREQVDIALTELPTLEVVASRLQAATVTIRILPPRSEQDAANQAELQGVSVCSGAIVARGCVATFASAPADARYRITLAGGDQGSALLSVADHYTGLTLLVAPVAEGPPLELAEDLPAIGSEVLTAAASGSDLALISLGILGGTDRYLGKTALPPLLQCDVSVTNTSSGAPLVDRRARLIGIVAAASSGDQAGWTYAVPARHVRRLLAAKSDGRIVILERRRPVLGCRVGAGDQEGTVCVEHVDPDGPAAQAGLVVGDLLLAADGRKLRSAYQAIDLILKKQPGDSVELLVQQNTEIRHLEVTLGGAAADPLVASAIPSFHVAQGKADPLEGPTPDEGSNPFEGTVKVGPQRNVRAVGRGKIEVRDTAADASAQDAADGEDPPPLINDEVAALRVQVAAFDRVIAQLQAELKRREALEIELRDHVHALAEEVERLRTERGQD